MPKAKDESQVKHLAWRLFDRIVGDAASDGDPPWYLDAAGQLRHHPDYTTLTRLLAVPPFLGADTQSGLPARAVDVWVAHEFRRVGFDADAVWPRANMPRVLPRAVATFISGLKKAEAAQVRESLAAGNTFKGSVSAEARILGKNYEKQVDVGMSDWDTGPELLVSTKRMGSSFSNNAVNRVEESYGDAKNLRARHPRAALGFVFALSATALTDARHAKTAAFIFDLLVKLGREEDAYDHVALILPSDIGQGSPPGVGKDGTADVDELLDRMQRLPPITLERASVPEPLTPERFFELMTRRVLDNSPIERHVKVRQALQTLDPKRR